MLPSIFNFLKDFSDKLIRHHSIEREILRWLDRNGFRSASARFNEVELFAIKSPGWLQVFRFQVEVMAADGQQAILFGALRSDERFGASKICAFKDLRDRDRQLREWSDGLIVRRSARR
jgi:hypothetical protein